MPFEADLWYIILRKCCASAALGILRSVMQERCISSMSDAMLQKRCYRCKQAYPLDFFYNNGANSDGKADACKQCSKEIQADRRKQQDPTIVRRCSCCKEMKPISEYWRAYPYCKSCSYAMRRERYKQIGGITEEEKQYRRVLYLKRNFNLSTEEYDEMFAQQFGLCAICGNLKHIKIEAVRKLINLRSIIATRLALYESCCV